MWLVDIRGCPRLELWKGRLDESYDDDGPVSTESAKNQVFSPGTLVAGCFRVTALANIGGMGVVYRGEDLSRQRAPVAIKVLPPEGLATTEEIERFTRESELLSTLRHPGIVGYVAHGQTSDGRPYLVMEWLEGESLAATLTRRRLSIGETITLLSALADALAFAHARGIMHRDLKPANVILREYRVEKAALVDFGVARWLGRTMQMTRTGMLIGTPGYMAPEQARGRLDVGPSADVFALGCIVFECLTGKAPFAADHIATVLTKILFEEVPPVRVMRPDTPPELEALVSKMLAKEPEERPGSARFLVEELGRLTTARLAGLSSEIEPAAPTVRKTLTAVELLLVSLVLATPLRDAQETIPLVSTSTVRTPFTADHDLPLRALTDLGAQVEYLADGSVAVIVSKTGSARDQVAQAARCALLLREQNLQADVILVTGRGALGPRARIPEGEVFQRAAALLGKRSLDRSRGRSSFGINIDEISASLLGREFHVVREDDGSALLMSFQNRAIVEDTGRPLLGRTIPFIGREREVSQLLSMLDGVVEEGTRSAVVLVAAAGMGKSRLLHEFLHRVQKERGDVKVFFGRGDPARVSSPYGLIIRLLRDLSGVRPDDDADMQRRKLEARLQRFLSPSSLEKTLGPLLELGVFSDGQTPTPTPVPTPTKTPAPTPENIKSNQTTSQPKAYDTRLSLAIANWLAAECDASPALLAIEDLHWVDAPSVRLLDLVLRGSQEMALFVVAIQRAPADPTTLLPWHGKAQEIRLAGLGKKAAEKIVRLALGDDIAADTLSRITQQAAGSPLFLEELVRAQALGKTDTPPETLLAILQARIQHLGPGARRLLRSASIFGTTFWKGGVLYLLGLDKTTDLQAVDRWIDELLAAELIEAREESRFPGDQEYAFRNGLVREAAYGLLTDDDRKLGHALVGLFLEQVGESDAALLAGHTYEIVQWLQSKHNAFFVSRLTMLTGIPLRKFTRMTPDDPAILKRLRKGLLTLLREDQIEEVRYLFKDSEAS